MAKKPTLTAVKKHFADLKNPAEMKAKHLLDEASGLVLCGEIKKRGKELDLWLHVAACSALNHYKEHGDTTLLTNLVLSMASYNFERKTFDQRSIRAADMRKWIKTHTGKELKWTVDHDKRTCVYKRKEKVDGVPIKGMPPRVDVEVAMANPFYLQVKENAFPEVEAFDVDNFLASVAKQLQDALDARKLVKEIEQDKSDGSISSVKKRKVIAVTDGDEGKVRDVRRFIDSIKASVSNGDDLQTIELSINKVA